MTDTPNESNNQQATRLLFLHAQTPLHPGSGTALGTVDLPVQRERHTQWPVIPGSAQKGILRDLCRERAAKLNSLNRQDADKNEDIQAVFGPPAGSVDDDANAHAGALSVTDARILAFPVRSLRGVFGWVTCPAVLERLNRDLDIANMDPVPISHFQIVKKGGIDPAGCLPKSPLLVEGDKLVLEEFEFTRKADIDITNMANWIANHAVSHKATQERIKNSLVLLTDDDFTHFVKHATEIMARIGLDYQTKTVKDGALFYQEFLPPETIFYSLVLASNSRYEKKQQMNADAVLAHVADALQERNVLQIGGDETTGKGLCLARLTNGKGGVE
ncbi:MAG: type III-B CRISPR module RAMP protein Cmr4 [Gemmataceae bacterium]